MVVSRLRDPKHVPVRVAKVHFAHTPRLVAWRLHAPPSYAERLATYTFWNVRPPVDYGYFSPECRNGGTLDLRPAVSAWP